MNNRFQNKLICGDNFDELAHLDKESVDLIYIDPPFFTHKQYEVIWGDEAETRSFEDRWEGGIEHYVGWMRDRVRIMRDILKPDGSLYLHCDWHAAAHLKIVMDDVFGLNCFQNEIIWWYHTGGASKKRYARSHDNLLFYTKGKKWTFNWRELKYRRTEKALERAKNPKGARISSTDIYKVPEDVLEIQQMNPMAKERLGYPTQKPEALLESIIKVSSNPGDLVLDAFCGCGTALVVAQKLKRHWIGIDISPTAIKVVEDRFARLPAAPIKNIDYIVIGAPKTLEQLKKLKPFEFQNWVINEMGAHHSRKKVGDMGLDGYLPRTILHGEAGIQVKQSENIGRNVIDNFVSALQRVKCNKGYIIAFSFGKGAHEEVARLKNEGAIDIKLVNVEDLLYKKKPIE
jgi:DNA modification methylase